MVIIRTIGYDAEEIVQLLELVRESPSSVQMVEEGHAASAVLVRDHNSIGQAVLKDRAMVAQSVPLFNGSKEARDVAKLDAKIDSLEARRPQNIGGEHMFLKELVHRAVPKGAFGSEESMGKAQQCFKERSALYNAFPPAVRTRYDADAEAHIGHQKGLIAARSAEHLDKRARLAEVEEARVLSKSLPNRVSNVRFTHSDMEKM